MTTIEASAAYPNSTADAAYSSLVLARKVREVTAAEAPVALRVPANQSFRAPAGSANAAIRTIDGGLYCQNFNLKSGMPLTANTSDLSWLDTTFGLHNSVTEAKETLRKALAGIILIDGFFWTRITEPALVLDRHGMSITIRNPYGCSPWMVYSLAEEEEAVEAARRLRRDNGMTAEPHPSALNPGIELLMPEVITMTSNAERMETVHAEASARTSAAVALLEDFTPRNIHEASRILAQVAEDLNAQTTGSSWHGGSR